MGKIKDVVVTIPILGYLLRLGSSIVHLPRHTAGTRHSLHEHHTKIQSLEAGLQRSNLRVIELTERLDKLKLSNKK